MIAPLWPLMRAKSSETRSIFLITAHKDIVCVTYHEVTSGASWQRMA